MRKHLPNIITLMNLVCGCMALVAIFNDQFMVAFTFLVIGGLADYADGLVARWIGVNSPLGKELDSLADMVSFGVVPGAILYELLARNYAGHESGVVFQAMPAFLLSAFACYRLAKFNLDNRQSDDFLGIPTPAMTIFVTGLMLIYYFDSYGLRSFVSAPFFVYAVVAFFSFLMLSELPMFSFKFKGNGWRGNELRWLIFLLSFTFLIIFKEGVFSLIILVYILFSFINNILSIRSTRKVKT